MGSNTAEMGTRPGDQPEIADLDLRQPALQNPWRIAAEELKACYGEAVAPAGRQSTGRP